MNNPVRFLLFFFLLVSCGSNSSDSNSASLSIVGVSPQPEHEGPFFWPREYLPLRVRYDRFLNAQSEGNNYHSLFKDVILQWEAVIPEETFFDFNFEDSIDLEGTEIQVAASTSKDHIGLSPKSLAVTDFSFIVYDNYSIMIEAKITFNADHRLAYNFLPSNSSTEKVFDVQSIFLHEIGHLLGLNHPCLKDTPCPHSVMRPQLPPNVWAREVLPHDANALVELYEKRESLLEYDFIPPTRRASLFDLSVEDTLTMKKLVRKESTLYVDGRCVHRQNGRVVNTHRVHI